MTGRSEVGAKAASSHTASLAGSDVTYDALFEQYGVHRARTTQEQIDEAQQARMSEATAGMPLPPGMKLPGFM